MICTYCGKDLQDSKRTYPELRELIRSKDSNRSLHVDDLYRVSEIFSPARPTIIDICTDCEYAIAEDANKFILKQRLLR
jgi:hypothetical protein